MAGIPSAVVRQPERTGECALATPTTYLACTQDSDTESLTKIQNGLGDSEILEGNKTTEVYALCAMPPQDS